MWYFLINGMKGFGEEDMLFYSICFYLIFVQEGYIIFFLNGSEGNQVKIKKKRKSYGRKF